MTFYVNGQTIHLTDEDIALLRQCYFRPLLYCRQYCESEKCMLYEIKVKHEKEGRFA